MEKSFGSEELDYSKLHGFLFLEEKTKPYHQEVLNSMNCSASPFSNGDNNIEMQPSRLWVDLAFDTI